MERTKLGFILAIVGIAILLISLFVVLPLEGVYYIISLFGMFAGIVMFAVGVAFSREMEHSLGIEKEDCYYCKGNGKINGETCPRCGGTGISPDKE